MNTLVIGVTGLVGSYLLPKLIQNGHEVLAFTRVSSKIVLGRGSDYPSYRKGLEQAIKEMEKNHPISYKHFS